MKNRIAFLTIAAVLLVVLHTSVADACPGCKQALANADGEQTNMVNGYFWSILFMLSMPFTLFGAFSGAMYLAVRKARKERAGQGEPRFSGYQDDRHEALTMAGSGV
jgi:hypothetical protein